MASFGVAGMNAFNVDIGNVIAHYDMFVDHNYVRRTVHMVAEDEIRGNFPVTSIFMDPKDKDSWVPWTRRRYQDPKQFKGTMIELWYPGVHSDVGGSYFLSGGKPARPEQRHSYVDQFGMRQTVVIPARPAVPPLKPDLSLIPLRDMHKASLRAEVPLGGLSSTQGPDDMERWYAEYDAFRSGQPYALNKQYIQTFENLQYIMLYYGPREHHPAIVNLKTHYIHDSRWIHDKLLLRTQRTVLYMGPQPTPSR